MSLFDLSEDSVTGIEDGMHVIIVDDAEVRETKKKQNGEAKEGEYVNIKWKLESNGSTFYQMYNTKNDNPDAAKYGRADLKRMMIAAGVEPKASGVDELIGLRVLARLVNKEDDFGERVVIKSYKKAPAVEAF